MNGRVAMFLAAAVVAAVGLMSAWKHLIIPGVICIVIAMILYLSLSATSDD
jgi:hypothetical protein